MSRDASRPAGRSTVSRIVDLLFGTFLVVLAIAIVIWSDQSNFAGSVVAALVVGGLGVEAVFSAARGKRSLLARIGPLP
jgi:glycerol uptake facilitator-like aquaporin